MVIYAAVTYAGRRLVFLYGELLRSFVCKALVKLRAQLP